VSPDAKTSIVVNLISRRSVQNGSTTLFANGLIRLTPVTTTNDNNNNNNNNGYNINLNLRNQDGGAIVSHSINETVMTSFLDQSGSQSYKLFFHKTKIFSVFHC
jgi:hypothetical protein